MLQLCEVPFQKSDDQSILFYSEGINILLNYYYSRLEEKRHRADKLEKGYLHIMYFYMLSTKAKRFYIRSIFLTFQELIVIKNHDNFLWSSWPKLEFMGNINVGIYTTKSTSWMFVGTFPSINRFPLCKDYSQRATYLWTRTILC